jgi:SAM-dependent methyltransferase
MSAQAVTASAEYWSPNAAVNWTIRPRAAAEAYDPAMPTPPHPAENAAPPAALDPDARKAHWEHVYASKAVDAVSWYEPSAARSLALVRGVAPDRSAAIIDVGGGASRLVDALLDAGYANPTILDLAAAAMDASRRRLGERTTQVTWLQGDVLAMPLAPAAYDVWHDRAVFHFLTEPGQRARYKEQLARSLRPGGHLVIACFAADGPTRCSGLPVVRYDAATLAAELGEPFVRQYDACVDHVTPSGSIQRFLYTVFLHRTR